MSIFYVLGTLVFAFSSNACRSDKKFATKVESSEAAKNSVEATPAADSVAPTISNGPAEKAPVVACDKDAVGITQARLLSNGISTQLGTQTLRYELAVLSCKDGSIESLKDQPVFFDLNASLSNGFQPIPYAVLDMAGTTISNATLQVVTGSDLFGNTGNFAHYTTQSFSYTAKLAKLILEIKLENLQVLPFSPTDTKINSYLRIGKAQAITQELTITD
jgi:hypothetical protein